MTKTFLPDYGTMSLGGQYRGLYKLFDGDRWHIVMKDGKPVICSSATEALAVAKDHVRAILNPTIRSATAPEPEPIDPLGVDEWRAQKQAAAAIDQEAVFGARVIRGRLIPVEPLKKRRRRMVA